MTRRATETRRERLLQDLRTPGKLIPPLMVQDTALVLGVSRRTVVRLIDRRVLRKERGKIPAAVVRAQLT